MDSSLFFWIEAIIAVFMGLLMILNYLNYKKKTDTADIFKSLFFVFILILVKSAVYIGINFTDVLWFAFEKDNAVVVGDIIFGIIKPEYNMPNQVPPLPVYELKFFIWQIMETLFIIGLSYVFILRRKKAETDKVGGIRMMKWLQVILLALIALTVGLLSMQSQSAVRITEAVKENTGNNSEKFFVTENGWEVIDLSTDDPAPYQLLKDKDKETLSVTMNLYDSGIPAIEFIKGWAGRAVLVLWKVLLMVFALLAISSTFGYIANLLEYIDKNKKILYIYLFLQIVVYIGSTAVSYYSSGMVWFAIDLLGLILFSVFAYRVHSQYIHDIEEAVESLANERDLIIKLMKDISAIIGAGEFDLDTIVKQIVDACVTGANCRGGTVFLRDEVTSRLNVKYVNGLYPPTRSFKMLAGMTLTESVIIEKLKSEKIAVGEGLLGKVAESGELIYIPDTLKDESFVQTIPDTMLVTSFIAVPLKSQDEVFGVLSVVDDARSFLESDVSLIETLGEQAAITIKQIQMYKEILDKKQAEKELSVAGEIQSSLTPHSFPEADKYEMFAFSIPAKGVGGDYYDYIDFGNNKIAVTMFDVSGKGVPAALIMVMIRSILRTIASLDEDTKDVLTKLNNTISEEIVEDRYATGFYLLFDAERGIMSYTNAGHGPLCLYRKSKDTFEFLDTDGMPVGIMSGIEFGQNYTTLEKGDIAILYTDGITEAMNLEHEEYGMDSMQEVVRACKNMPAQEIANRILDGVNHFVKSAPQHDDETLLVLKMK
ncbi:MAG: hypothetical protein A2Y33_09425 [Spirochaetes bacterium GWF1_51_8]|nr:MAG: hypothetical protein A2Y33_09425 [Spirochaetes bacterium GWF1_51_8]